MVQVPHRNNQSGDLVLYTAGLVGDIQVVTVDIALFAVAEDKQEVATVVHNQPVESYMVELVAAVGLEVAVGSTWDPLAAS